MNPARADGVGDDAAGGVERLQRARSYVRGDRRALDRGDERVGLGDRPVVSASTASTWRGVVEVIRRTLAGPEAAVR